METGTIHKENCDLLVSFEQHKCTFLTPRGRYGIELYNSFMRMRGRSNDYRIEYNDINGLFLLPKPDADYMVFIIALDKPIQQGKHRYRYLVMQVTKASYEVTVNLNEETIQKEYSNELKPVMRGSLSNLIENTFKSITRKNVVIPVTFANAQQQASLKCSVRANKGLLYPLETQFVFIYKPPIIIPFDEIESGEFQGYNGSGQGSASNFDLCINLKQSDGKGAVKDYNFSGIARAEYTGLYTFLSGKQIPIKNLHPSTSDFIDVSKSIKREDNSKFADAGGDVDDRSDNEECVPRASAKRSRTR